MSSSPLRKISAVLIFCLGLYLAGRFLLPVFMPFLLAGLLALAAEPLVSVLQNRLRLRRGIASGIGVVIALILAALIVLTLCALLLRQLSRISGALPDLEDTALSGMQSLEGFLLDMAASTPDAVSPILVSGVQGFFSDSTKFLDRIVSWVLGVASGILTRIPDSALGFGTWILASFMISAKLPDIRTWLRSRIPQSWTERYLPAIRKLRANLGGWLTAQLKLTGLTFLVLNAGFLLLRIHNAPLWAALICLVDALPVLGTGTVLIPWSIVCFLQGETVRALGILGTYAVAALLRSVLEPKLIGKQLGLDPLVTLIAMYAGFKLWGILGMIFSPLLAVTVTQLTTATQKE